MDYGYINYLKIRELSKRLDKLEKNLNKPTLNKLDFSFELLSGSSQGISQEIDFTVSQKSRAQIWVSGKVVGSTLDFCNLYFMSDGKMVASIPVLSDGTFNQTFELDFEEGDRGLTLYASAMGVIDVENLAISVQGYVVNRPIDGFLTFVGGDIYAHTVGKTAYFYKGAQKERLFCLYNVKFLSAIAENNSVHACVTSQNGSVLVYTYSLVSKELFLTMRVKKRYAYASLFVENGVFKLFAVRAGMLFEVVLSSSGEVTETKSPTWAARADYVQGENVNYLAITDGCGFVCIYTVDRQNGQINFTSKKSMGKISSFHIIGDKVWFCDNGVVAEKSITGLAQLKKAVVTADDAIKTQSGITVGLVGGQIKIITGE